MVVAVLADAIDVADAGCRGFFGPIPLPLWMSGMKLSAGHVTAQPRDSANVRSIIRERLNPATPVEGVPGDPAEADDARMAG